MTAPLSSTFNKLNQLEQELHGTLSAAFNSLARSAPNSADRTAALNTIEQSQKRLYGIMYQRRKAYAMGR